MRVIEVVFTEHALERYVERVKLNLTLEQARVEVEALRPLCHVCAEAPVWTNYDPGLSDLPAPTLWLCFEHDFCFMLQRHGTIYRATTCVARGQFSAEIAQRRHDKRKRRGTLRHVRQAGRGKLDRAPGWSQRLGLTD